MILPCLRISLKQEQGINNTTHLSFGLPQRVLGILGGDVLLELDPGEELEPGRGEDGGEVRHRPGGEGNVLCTVL